MSVFGENFGASLSLGTQSTPLGNMGRMSEMGRTGSKDRAKYKRQTTVGHLRQKHLYDDHAHHDEHRATTSENRATLANVDPKFAAHLDLGSTIQGNDALGVQSLVLGVHGIQSDRRQTRNTMKDNFERQHRGRAAMHRGMGLSHFLLGNSLGSSSFGHLGDGHTHAHPETLTALEGHHAEASGSSSWAAAAPKVGSAANPLLEDEHLKMLLGDVSSELMLKVQKASAALDKLWVLLDTDEDGMINYVETRNIFAKWCHTLAGDAEKFILDFERSSESRISYARFLDIFLPLALTVPPDLIFEHLSSRFAEATAHLNKKRASVHAHVSINEASGGQPGNKRDSMKRDSTRRSMFGSNHSGDGEKRDSARRSMAGPSHGVIPDTPGAAAPDKVGENLRKADAHRKKGSVHRETTQDFAIGGAKKYDSGGSGSGSSGNRNSIGSVVGGRSSLTNEVGVKANRSSVESAKPTASKSKIEAIKQNFMDRSSQKVPGGVAPRRKSHIAGGVNHTAAIKGAAVRSLFQDKRASG